MPGFGWVWVRGAGEFVRSQPSDTLDTVRTMAGVAALDCQQPIGIGELFGFIGERALYRKVEIVEPVPIESLLVDAHKAVDDLLSDIFKVHPVLNPATRTGRAMMIRQTADAMVATVRPWEQRMTTAGNKFLKQNWPDMTATERRAAIQAASSRIKAVPVRSVKGINKVISIEGGRAMAGARRNAVDKFRLNIGANLTSPDREALRASQATSVRWLTNEYGVRATQFEADAQRIVQQGLAQGLGRGEISNDLRSAFGTRMAGRTDAYFRVFAGALVDRSRTRAELHSYREARITKYVASAVLDEVTTEFCRWVDGKVFEVERSLGLMDEADKPGLSVDEMKAANPWVSETRGPGGEVSVGVRGGPELFTVQSSGMGTQAPGQYRDSPAGRDPEGARVGPPPYHGNCRTTTAAQVDVKQVPIVQPAIGARPPQPIPNIKPPPTEKLPKGYLTDETIRGVKFNQDQLSKAVIAMDRAVRRGKGGMWDAPLKSQKNMRRQLNGICRDRGMVSHDVISKGAGRARFGVEPLGDEAYGLHFSSMGMIQMNAEPIKSIAEQKSVWQRFVAFAKGERDIGSLRGFKTAVHETVHAHSPMVHEGVYTGIGKKLEEATTELAARRIVADIAAVSSADIPPSYAGWVKAVEQSTRNTMKDGVDRAVRAGGRIQFNEPRMSRLGGTGTARDIAEQASINMRKTTRTFSTPNQYVDHFADSASWPDELFAGLDAAAEKALRKQLRDTLVRELKSNLEGAAMW